MAHKTRQQRKLSTILGHAARIFAEKGYHHASVRDIAAATGVSPASLYYYFESKEDLLYLILEGCMTSLLARVRQAMEGLDDPALQLRGIARAHLTFARDYRHEMRVMVAEWRLLSGPQGERIRKPMRDYTNLVIRSLRALAPDLGAKELRATAFAFFGMLSWVEQWHRPRRDLPLEQLADRFTGILLTGLREPIPLEDLPAQEPERESATTEWAGRRTEPSLLSGPGF